MEDISLHILDLVQNSIKANADNIEIIINEDIVKSQLTVTIIDDGYGMNQDTVSKALDPFYTTRSTRRVGLGLPLLKYSAEATEGSFEIISAPDKGTQITAIFNSNHIDCLPLGSIEDTITTLIICNHKIEFVYSHQYGDKIFKFDTIEIKKILDGVPINHPDVINWIQEYIRDGLNEISGGV